MKHNNRLSWNIFYNKQVVVLSIFFFWNLLLLNGQTYRIDTLNGQTVNTCAGTFYDSGGPSGYYGNNEDYTVSFCSDNGLTISLDFTTFEVRTGDTLRIYDGPDTGSSLLGSYVGEGITFTVTSSGTCLTLNFISDPSFNREGWVASILCDFCTPPVTSPISPSDNEVCAGEIINYSVDDHAGSTYTWTIVNGTPASLVDGPNNLDVTWSSTGGISGLVKVIETNSCGAKDSSKLIVDIYALPTVSFSGLGSDYCIDDSPVTLTGNPAGGTFSGPGMTGDVFDPSDAGAGTHNITYSYTDPGTGCSNQDIQSVDVHDLPTVSFSGLDPFYDITDSPVTLTGNPAGGTFSGPGIAGDVFDPAVAGYGLHEIVYEYTDVNGCTNSDTAYTEIRNYDVKAGAITLSDLNNWCSNDAEYTTTGATADELKGSCWNTGPNYNRWFRFQATTTEINIQVKIGGDDGTMRYPYVALWDGSNTELACARYSSQYSDLQIGSSSLTPGVWYYISVDNYANAGYQGSFTLCITDINDYDFKAGAIELTDLNNWCSADAAYTTISASADESKGTCWNTGPNYNRWFKFTATSNEALIQVKTGGTEGTMRYPYIAMWNEAGEQVACARYSYDYSDLTIGSDTLTIGETYYIAVDNYANSGYQGSFTLCITDVIDYDFKAGAIVLSDLNNWCSADAAYTTASASADESKGTCWNTGPNYNRWFKFTATGNEALIRLKTGGSEGTMRYPYIAMWNEAGEQVACARYSFDYSDLTIGSDTLTLGKIYYIAVDNYANSGYQGTFTLCITDNIDYDFKAGAIVLSDLNNWCSADAAYTTTSASADESAGTCWNTGPNYNRWFKFTATSNEALVQLKTGGSEGTMRYPYIAMWNEAGEQVACARYSFDYSDLTIGSDTLTIGKTYYIAVDNYANSGYQGSFTLCITDNIDYDFKAGAIVLSDLNNWCSADAVYTTTSASADESKGTCWNTGPNYNRWFKFTATSNEALIRVKTGGSEGTMRYPYIAMWNEAGEQVACARYSYDYSDLTIGSDTLTIGKIYYIAVDNYANSGYQGTFTLCITDNIDYDFKAGAIVLSDLNNWCSADAAYTTISASADESAGTCWNTGPNYNRWFKFTATSNETLIRLKTGGSEGTMRYPYIAMWNEAGEQVACARYSYDYSDLTIGSDTLTLGKIYYIAVDNYANSGYQGSFTLCITDNIDYDFKAGAIEITNYNNYCSVDAEYSTINASSDGNQGSCWNTGPNFNRWFMFQATGTDVTIQVKTGGSEGTMRYAYVALWDDLDVELACQRYSSDYSDLEITYTGMTIGDWYYVTVDNYNNTGYRGSFTLCIDDDLSYNYKDGAIELSDFNGWCSGEAAFSTINATSDESAGSCWANGPNYNRWFKFQAPGAEISIQVRTTGSEGTLSRSFVALWDASLTEVSCNTYNTDGSDIEIAAIALTPGAWYYISVDNYTGTGYRGSFTLCITDNIVNDDKANAIEIIDFNNWCSGDAKYSNIIAGADGPAGSCFTGGVNNRNVWFKFQATNTKINISVTTGNASGEMRGQQIAMFNSIDVEVGCIGPLAGTGTQTLTVDTLTIGNWYWVSVDDNNTSGTFTICADDELVYPYPPGAEEITNINNWCSSDAAYTNIGAAADTWSGTCWSGATYNNKWFKFQATTSQIQIQVKTGGVYGNMQRQQVALFNEHGVEVACTYWIYNQGTITLQSDSLTAGNWYWFAVDDDGTSGSFSLCLDDSVDYDFHVGAIELTDLNDWCSNDAAYNNLFATPDESPGSCWSDDTGDGNRNVWFKFQATTEFIRIRVKTGNVYGSMDRQQVALWNAADVQVACTKWVYNEGTINMQTDTLTPGNWYWISVDDDRYQGSFTLCVNDQVDYDYKAGAIELTNLNDWCSNDAAYNNLFATPDESPGSCWSDDTGDGNRNVWFKFQATTEFIKIRVKTGNVYGSMDRQQVALWNAADVQVACTKWVYNEGTITMQTDTLIPGNWYWISVDDDRYQGSFTLCIDDQIDYDYKAGAIELTDLNDWCSNDAAYNNLFATPDESPGSCWSDDTGDGNRNVWFKFQATTEFIRIRVKTGNIYGSMDRQQIALWNAVDVQVGCVKWVYNEGTITMQTDTLTIGNWYWISVDDDRYQGSFTLCIDDQIDYDYKAGAIELTDLNDWCSNDAAYDNLFATPDGSQGSCWSDGTGDGNRNVWFKFQATTEFIRIRVKTGNIYGSMDRQQVALWNVADVQVGCVKWVYNEGTITMQTDTLTIGNWYWISVDDDRYQGSFTLCIDDQIDYDYKAGAIELTNLNDWCSNDAAYNNLFATPDESPGSCWSDDTGDGNRNVWFKFQATTEFIRIRVKTGNIYGSMDRQQIALWNAADVQVGCVKWVYNEGTITMQTDTLTIGNWYWISVDDDRYQGSFTLCIDDQVDYDYKAGAIELTNLNDWCSNDAEYSNLYATDDESMASCWGGTVNKNVWFKFQAVTTHLDMRLRTGSVYGSMRNQQFTVWNEVGAEVICEGPSVYLGDLTASTDTLTIGHWYWISVDDDNTSGSFTLCVNGNPLYVDVVKTDITCNGDDDGTASANASGGTGPGTYSYSWTGPGTFTSTLQTITNLEPGAYNVIVTDANSTTASGSATINEPSAINISETVVQISCNSADDGSIDITVTGGTGTYTFAWTGPGTYSSNQEDIATLAPGDYDLVVTDANNCTANLGTVTISEPAVLSVSTDVVTNVTCNGASDGTIEISVTGGTTPYSYSWTGPGAYSSIQEDIASLAPGNYNVVVTDANSCTANHGPITITTVVDITDPTITCPADVTVNVDAGLCTATGVALGSPTTADNCSVASVTNDGTEPYSLGNTTVTWTVTDGSGNTATCAQTVTVVDNIDPTITCPADVTVNVDAGLCTATGVALGSPTTADNCSVASVTNDGTEPYSLGNTTVTWTVTDGSGNTATCAQTVTVVDNIDPTITCPADVTVNVDAGLCTATGVALGSPTTADNCSVASVTNDGTEPYSLGNTTVTWTVTDGSGNTATCAQTVTVVDNIDPTITCPADVTVNVDAGLCTATGVALGSPTTADNCSVASVTNDGTEPYSLGNTTVTWTVTDGSGNTATCAQTVTVVDNIDPTITCPADVTVNVDAGLCTATGVALGSPTTADNCSVASVTNDGTEPYSLGNTTVTWTVTDGSGNTATCAQTVTVVDNIDPTITCPADVTVNVDAGLCTATGVALGSPTTADNCSVASVTNDGTEPYSLGNTTVTWTVTDGSGNTATCAQTVTVVDNIDPTITCPADVTINVDAGLCTATGVALGSPTTADNCSVASVTNDGTEPYSLGNTTVTWTVTDGSGNTATCAQTVTVVDNIDPTITCPADVTVNVDAGLCTATGVALGSPTTADNCSVASVTNDGTEPYSLGNTTVTWTVTDGSGNTATCAQTVTVVDNIDPTITCPADVTVNVDAGLCTATGVALGSPTTADNCSVASVTNDGIEPYALGNTTVTWTVTDGSGNTATCAQTVTVVDNIDPTITCPADVTVNVDAGLCTATGVALGSPTTADNCSVASVTNDGIEPYALGNTTVTWTVTDGSGNTATCAQTVTVVDNIDPTITCPADVTVNVDAGLCTATGVALGSPTTADNCSVASVTNDGTEPYSLGNTTVTWTVTDGSGNTATCAQTVTVVDNIDPTITCPADVTVNVDAGLCTATGVALGSPTTADNCSVASVTNDGIEPYALGNTTVTWTVTDGSGNTATCAQTVTVVDNIDPTITCPADVTVNVDAGLCTATGVALGSPTTADNCSVASVTNDGTEPYSLGNTTVTWTVTDGSGNTATCAQTVTVVDNIDPTITCPADVTVNVDAGLCTATGVALGSPTTADNCSVASVTNDGTEPYSLGNTTVTWTVTDGSGNTATCAQTVTVVDNIDPTITCPADVTVNVDAGLCTATGVALGSPTTADNCSVASVTNDGTEPYSLGNTTVTWTVTDGSGNTATCAQTVTVVDNIDPTITCPADVTVNVDAGLCTATGVALGSPTTADNCSVASVTNDGTEPYSLGNTTVTWTVTDGSGNTATCAQTVTVVDNIDPTITCPADVTVNVDAGLCTATGVALGSPTTADNCSVASVTNDGTEPYALGNTTVTWTVTDGSGNTATCTQTVTVLDNINPTITCVSDQTRNADAGVTYYTVSGTEFDPVSTSDNCGVASVINSINSGATLDGEQINNGTSITWTVTDNSANTAQCSFNVTVITLPENPGPITASDDTVCAGQTGVTYAIDSVDRATSYLWTVPTGASIVGVADDTLITVDYSLSAVSGNVTVVGVNANGNSAIPGTFAVVVNPVPVATLTSSDLNDTICVGETVTFIAEGGDIYEFFIDGISVQGPGVINVYITSSLNDGETVTVEVLDTITGCSAVSSGITISVPPALTITPTSDITLLCYGDSTASGTFTASGGTTPYLFTVDVNTAGASIGTSAATDISFTHGGVGEVTVNVIDNNGCTATSTITVTEPANLVISSTKINVTCYGESDGTIDISVTGGTTNYSYAWSHGPTTEDVINLTEGTYTVVVTDANGCTTDSAITISEPPALVINHVNTDVTCNNRNDGAINITASGGAGPYTYSWSHGPTSEDLTGLTAGDYTITVTDANSCTLDSTFTIYEPAAWDVSVSVTDVTCYGENNGRATVSISGGTQPYNYLWSDGQTGQIVDSLSPIDYSVTITDAIGCSWVEIVTITEPLPIITETEITDASCPGVPDGAIMLNISGGTTPYTVLWSNFATTKDLTNITNGTYTVEITDANLCTKTDSATVSIIGENCVTEIPSIITPNGDGKNDVWRIENIQLYSNATIEIYTRWGKLVYRSDNGNQDPWDGTFKGKELPMDSYHYIIDLGDGSKPIIGSVTIVR